MRRTSMSRMTSGMMVVGLLFATAACGSDDDSSDDTSATTSSVVVDTTSATVDTTSDTVDTTSATVDTTDSTTADTEGPATTGGSSDDVDISDLTPIQAQVVTDNLAAAEEQGIDIDEACFINAVSRLSDEDAEKIVEAGPSGDPDISEEGEAIGDAAGLCILFPDVSDTTLSTTGS